MVMNADLKDDLYLRFRDLLLTRCGLDYPERKRADLAHGLNRALGATRHRNLAELYADAVVGGPGWEAILAQLTIGETYFFRNGAQFDALRDQIVPELLNRRAATRTLRFWSAGCATGEEPYSLAIQLSELLPSDDSWNVSILATDINTAFLARAREALYGVWSFRETSTELRERFWIAEQGRWRLHSKIRRMVNFACLNLAQPCYPAITNGTGALDVIVCRNVTIYFDAATTRQVAERFYHALAPGGWLIVGHAEPQASVYHQFEVHNFPNTVIYRKPLDAPLFAFDPASGVFNAGTRPILIPGVQWGTALGSQAAAKQASEAAALPTLLKAPAPASEKTLLPAQQLAQPPTRPRHPTADLWPTIALRLAQGDKAGAETLLNDLLRADPSHMPALVALGQLYADRAEWASARQQCMLTLAQDSLCIPAHYLLAQIHEHQGQFDAALAAYRRTVYLDRSFVPGMLGMANVWRLLGRTADAQRAYRNALRYLATLPLTAAVHGIDGATVADILALAQQQLAALACSR
ncbi:MAG: CheR family methyltransferase [Roseiflexaceae bacterium]